MNQAQALYHLQTIDLTINEHQSRLAEIERLLGENAHVLAREQALRQAEEALAPWRAKVTDLELEIKTLNEKITTTEHQLYGGTITNPKELQDLQEESASLKRRRARLEDELLEAMIEVENGQAACLAARQDLEAVQAAWHAEQAERIDEREALRQALAELQARRQAALKDVSPEALSVYSALRASKHGYVVAELTDATCSRCGFGQTSTLVQQVRQGRTLVHCANCGRILVLP